MSKRELADRQKQPEPNDIPVKNAKGERMNVLDQIERKRKEQFEQVMHRETVQDEYIVPKQPEPNDSRPILDLVIEDMRERDHIGRERYGTPLQAHNGRDAMVDAYQEALDLVAYLRQVIEERSDLREQRDRLKKVIAILEDDVAKVTSDRDQAIAGQGYTAAVGDRDPKPARATDPVPASDPRSVDRAHRDRGSLRPEQVHD